ncbi:MAG: phage holin family protein [Chlorobi bacterium]|nr:phage holin family protein [Chlorobiota bacterium]
MIRETLRKNRTEASKQKQTGIPGLIDETVTSTYEDVLAIVEAKTELVKIDLTKKISIAAALLLLGVVLMIGVAYLITTIALLLGELTGHVFIGYLLVSLVFLSCFFFFIRIRPHLLPNLIQKLLLSTHDYK